MRTAILLAAATMLAGCAHTAEEQASVQSAWGDCIAKAVKRLDDGRTDPVSVAYGVAPQCAVLYAKLTDIMIGQNITENGQIAMRNQMKSNEIKMVTSAVLIFRAARHS